MKAALDGVPSLSVLDGWWVEGHVEGTHRRAVGDGSAGASDEADLAGLQRALRDAVLPLFYGDPHGYLAVARAAMALDGSYFTTERMVRQDATRAYWPGRGPLTRTAQVGSCRGRVRKGHVDSSSRRPSAARPMFVAGGGRCVAQPERQGGGRRPRARPLGSGTAPSSSSGSTGRCRWALVPCWRWASGPAWRPSG